MRKIFFTLILLSAGVLAAAQTCKSHQYDMLRWMAPQASTSNGHYNVVYPSTGTFYWVKSSSGYPWDVDTFDHRYIYQSITEEDWNNPKSYKIFEQPLPWMPRCIDIPATPGKISSVLVEPQNTNFDIHTSCKDFTTQNLGYVANEVWGPYDEIIGSLPAAPTLVLSYRYSCDSTYDNCRDMETFAMQHHNGMVQWTHYILQDGVYVQVNQTTQGTAKSANVTPVHPCWER
ncbi:MAG: hypothetical protein WB952_23865 [Terriglobales bacterium]